jgi:site-specific DNA recombinase
MYDLVELILGDIGKLIGEHVDKDTLIKDMQKKAEGEKKASSREIAALKNDVKTFERRKQVAEDKWLDGEITSEQYHEMLERISGDLSDAKQKLNDLLKEQEDSKPTIPDIAKLTSFDKFYAYYL